MSYQNCTYHHYFVHPGGLYLIFFQDKLDCHLVVNGNGYLLIMFFYQRKTDPK
ncbi:unnamed protein product [Staurois parvus]|uniref:Uncharacterized protein n=1 Tax=Staurois parvus TaxID=386267 RepID=A0ABN9CU46_9NEOB|nr:unnamed protein product [Staurois parvus]